MIERHPYPDSPLFTNQARNPTFKQIASAVASAARDDGIERSTSRVSDEWWAAARRAIQHAASKNPDGFTVDDVQDALAMLSIDPPAEGRAMGAAMTAAKKSGLIVPTDVFRTGRQPKSHANPRRVWKAKEQG